MASNQQSLADRMRAVQNQAPPIEVAGKQYVFRKLKRKECHRVLYNLVEPFITVVSTIMGAVDFDDTALTKGIDFSKIDVAVIGKVFAALPFEKFWDLAKSMLNGAFVGNMEIVDLDETEYYDDKQLELVQAVFAAIQVNYPFLTGWIRVPEKSNSDTGPTKRKGDLPKP